MLVDRNARNLRCRMAGDVAARIEADEQDEADETQDCTESKDVGRPTPVPNSILELSPVAETEFQVVEPDVDGGLPIDGTNAHSVGRGFQDGISRSRDVWPEQT